MSDEQYLVSEVFDSAQGEGANTGIFMRFIRFAGCNLSCSFCDTKYAWNLPVKAGDPIVPNMIPAVCSRDDIINAIMKTRARWVCFTGGEPLLQLKDWMVETAHAAGKRVAIETNGTVWNAAVRFADYVTISPKLPHEIAGGFRAMGEVDELRFVIDPTDKEFPCKGVRVKAKHVCLSPMFDPKTGKISKRALKLCLRWIKQYTFCRLSVQLHKLIGIE